MMMMIKIMTIILIGDKMVNINNGVWFQMFDSFIRLN